MGDNSNFSSTSQDSIYQNGQTYEEENEEELL